MIMFSRNIFGCKQVVYSVFCLHCCCVFYLFAIYILRFAVACLFLCHLFFFILTLLQYFYLFVNHLNKPTKIVQWMQLEKNIFAFAKSINLKTSRLQSYCCCMFTCLSLFYAAFCYTVVAIFLFICWSCKQVPCFCFWSFCLSA